MADLAANNIIETQLPGMYSFPIADNVTLYPGAIVALEGGYLNHWADGANDVLVGVFQAGDSRLNDGVYIGETSDSPPPEGRVDGRGVILRNLDSVGDTPTQAKVGDLVYSSSSNTDDFTLDSTGRTHPIGILVRYRSATDVDVQLFTMAQMLAQATA